MHGYFKFFETASGQVSTFMQIFDLILVPKDDFYTFPFLVDAKDYSVPGAPYLGFNATKFFTGQPWEVMQKNSLVYDIDKNSLVNINTVTKSVEVEQAGNYFLASGLIFPGSITADGTRVKDYSAWYSRSAGRFIYSDVAYV